MKTLLNILIAILFMNATFTQAQTSKQKEIEVSKEIRENIRYTINKTTQQLEE